MSERGRDYSMSFLLFLDESGHDHKRLPLEVRGGVAMHAGRYWEFVECWRSAEVESFGFALEDYGKEVKGSKLLDKDRFRWAASLPDLTNHDRRSGARSFVEKGLTRTTPSFSDFAAYGSACIRMAAQIVALCEQVEAKLFAVLIPRGTRRPHSPATQQELRPDHRILFETYAAFLDEAGETGLLVMDEVDRNADKRFSSGIQRHFRNSTTGQAANRWIVPVPFFTASEMSCGVQAADLAMYAINWGYRREPWGSGIDVRNEIRDGIAARVAQLEWKTTESRKVIHARGITFLANLDP